MVLFSGQVQSACGVAGSSTGPFYCPADSKVYIDLSFYKELETKFKAPGDFAMAYVIAHEVGHHVQNQLGVMNEVNGLRGRLSDKENNELSVRLELQADYLAGVWAKHAQSMDLLDQGDVEEALNAANAIGDDRIQKQTQGYVVPDSFTHGTSAQRIKWFTKGFQEGDLDQWDTFSLNEVDLYLATRLYGNALISPISLNQSFLRLQTVSSHCFFQLTKNYCFHPDPPFDIQMQRASGLDEATLQPHKNPVDK